MRLLDAPSERRRRKYRGWTQFWLYLFAGVNLLAAFLSTRRTAGVLLFLEGTLLVTLTLQVFRSTRPWKWPLLGLLIAPFVVQMISMALPFIAPAPSSPPAPGLTDDRLDEFGRTILTLMGYGALQVTCIITLAASWAVGALGPPRSAVIDVFE